MFKAVPKAGQRDDPANQCGTTTTAASAAATANGANQSKTNAKSRLK